MNATLEAAVAVNEQRRTARSAIVAEPKLAAFQKWVREHYGNQQELADAVMTSRAHLSEVLGGHRRGKHTWARLVRVLPPQGLSLLQQCPAWNTDAAKALAKRKEAA